MSSQIEKTRKRRAVARASVTRGFTEMEQLLQCVPVDRYQATGSFHLLESKCKHLEVADSEIYEIMLEDATEEDLLKEVEACDSYKRKFMDIKVKYDELQAARGEQVNARSQLNVEDTHGPAAECTAVGKRKFKLPKIEFKHYDGNIKNWVSFWAQFKKIHEDEDIDEHDKIEYLIQATTPGSRARQLVESYPAMAENYKKIIDGMQSRFGREDLLIEVYVRELLKLILSNAAAPQEIEISTLYDKIETQLRALETLGVTSEKCSAILFPLIESCLPQELLRVWQRSASSNETVRRLPSQVSLTSAKNDTTENRLQSLMDFLRREVENEQRISLANEGFGLNASLDSTCSTEFSDTGRKKQSKVEIVTPTATGLVNCESKCIFCNGVHESHSCFKARKLSFDEKKRVSTEKDDCFRCLKVGHQARKCRLRTQCIVCNKTHVALMCPDLPGNKREHNIEPIKEESRTQDQTLANYTNSHVFLQTLNIFLKCKTVFVGVRALIDTGSHRSYILKSTAMRLGYSPKRKENLIHCLFGGVEKMTTHNCFDITVIKDDFSCHFEVMDQSVICNNLSPVFNGPWLIELKNKGIEISDANSTGPIEILIGADVAANIYTGNQHTLSSGLLALETKLGWTLMGKTPLGQAKSTVAMTTISLLINDMSIAKLWELDVLGITDPAGKHSRHEMERAAKQLFLETVKINNEGRYEVYLPWIEGHLPLPTNYRVAQNRLNSTLRKLKKEDLVESYNTVFEEWLSEGIIERVKSSSQIQGHYLPRHPVIKESSLTTKIRPVFDASAREKDGISLNQCLEKGPNLIELIPSILLKFRENRIGVMADIRKAFLQISLNENDRDFLKFLWVDSEENIITYRHRRVVFGVSSSPFLLGATIDHHLSDCRRKCFEGNTMYSLDTVDRLASSFYVDNCVTSVSDRNTLQRFQKEAIIIMQEAKFDLRGWESTENASDSSAVVSVLGLRWNLKTDTLSINDEFIKKMPNLDESLVKGPSYQMRSEYST